MTKQEIAEKLQSDDKWLLRGILAIWRFQTKSEKLNVTTNQFNGIGFNGCDGAFLTSLGNILRGQEKKGEVLHLSTKQIFVARKKMAKYAGQLERIANKTQVAPAPVKSIEVPYTPPKWITNSDYKKSCDKQFHDSLAEDMYWKNQYAIAEREAERKAFESDPDYQRFLKGESFFE